MGRERTFAAFAHEINVKSEGEQRQCGQSYRSLRPWKWLLSFFETKAAHVF
jgi:hypothetical protein